MEQNFQHRENLVIQLKEAYGRVAYTYTTHLKMVDQLVIKNTIIKYVQILMSAISTGGFFGSIIIESTIITIVGGIFSSTLLAINLFFKDFNLLEEIKQHRTTAENLWMVREDYISLLTDFSVLGNEDIIAKRDELQLRVHQINKVAPKADSKAYSKAQKALQSEEEQFFSSDEMNKILPPHLRDE